MIKLYKNPWKVLVLVFAGLSLVFVSYWIIGSDDISMFVLLVAYFGVFFFGIGLIIGLYHFIDFRAQIVITEDFFYDRMHQIKFNWGEVQDCFVYHLRGQKVLSLKLLENGERGIVYKFFAKLNELLGANATNVNLSYLDVDPEKLSDFIKLMNRIEPERRLDTINHFKNRLK